MHIFSKLLARLRPPPRLTALRELTERIGKIEIAYAALDDHNRSDAEVLATFRIQVAARRLAETCGLAIDDAAWADDPPECPVDEAELDEARSLLLRHNIPEALIHIERAAPDHLGGLPEAVASHYGKQP